MILHKQFKEWVGRKHALADGEVVNNLIWALAMDPTLHQELNKAVLEQRSHVANEAAEVMTGNMSECSHGVPLGRHVATCPKCIDEALAPDQKICMKCKHIMPDADCGDELPEERVCDPCADLAVVNLWGIEYEWRYGNKQERVWYKLGLTDTPLDDTGPFTELEYEWGHRDDGPE